MRNIQECYEEALRRSEEQIKERKKRRTRILVACIPMVLCLTIFAGFLSPGLGVTTDMAEPEAGPPLYNAESAMGDGAVILMDSVEVVGNGLAHKFTSPEEVQEITVSVPNTLPEDTVYALCAELRRIKKAHGSWELVNVQSSDGDSVQIIL